jgi:hypothetical protein
MWRQEQESFPVGSERASQIDHVQRKKDRFVKAEAWSDRDEFVTYYAVLERDADLIEEDGVEHQGHRSFSVTERGFDRW